MKTAVYCLNVQHEAIAPVSFNFGICKSVLLLCGELTEAKRFDLEGRGFESYHRL